MYRGNGLGADLRQTVSLYITYFTLEHVVIVILKIAAPIQNPFPTCLWSPTLPASLLINEPKVHVRIEQRGAKFQTLHYDFHDFHDFHDF